MIYSNPIFATAARPSRRLPSQVQSTLCAAGLLAAVLAASLAASTAQAQPAVKTAKPDPLDPNANVPALNYESSLSRYRLMGDEKPVSWRDANDTVTRIGGWRAYAREAQQTDAAPAAPAASAVMPADKVKSMPLPMPATMPIPPAGPGGSKAQ